MCTLLEGALAFSQPFALGQGHLYSMCVFMFSVCQADASFCRRHLSFANSSSWLKLLIKKTFQTCPSFELNSGTFSSCRRSTYTAGAHSRCAPACTGPLLDLKTQHP